jgi:hypothetical protein
MIGVSKLSCPACAMFLAVMRGDHPTDFGIRGCHETGFSVEMPDWLPVNESEVMATQVEGRLRAALITLATAPKAQNRHRKDASMQSDASVHTDSSGENPVQLRFK